MMWPSGTPSSVATLAIAIVATAAAACGTGTSASDALVATVSRADVVATLTTSGTLRPRRALTYRSPVPGRELEIRDLAAEGSRVEAGALLIRFGTTDLEADLDRARQEARQADLDAQVADGELADARAAVTGVVEGEGALAVEEARGALQATERRVARLREEFAQLRPLLEKGFITREELARTSDQLEQAEQELALATRRAGVMKDVTHPRERQRASLQLSQATARQAQQRTRATEARARVAQLAALVEACTVRAQGPGLVVLEEFLGANPRRKVRVGDRVTSSQGVVTIPEVARMQVETSIAEADLHRVTPGQRVTVRVEAYPDVLLQGTVARVGTLASTAISRPFEEKRFDVVVALDAAAGVDLRPEMTARVDITVGTRAGALVVPVTAVFRRPTGLVAYVVDGRDVTAHAVTLGASDSHVVEILSGLAEGQRVSLVDPERAAERAGTSDATR